MKKISFNFISFLLVIILCISLSACRNTATETDIWKDALYTENTELGKGDKTVLINVTVEDKIITFTINTDKKTLGEALTEHGLIDGEKGAYGLYVKKVNGITADYDKDKTYWGFNKNGESMLTGVDSALIEDGDRYEIIYTK